MMKTNRFFITSLWSVILFSHAFAQGKPALDFGESYAIIIGGIGGQEEFTEKYYDQTRQMYDILVDTLKYQPEHVFYFFEKPAYDSLRIRDKSTAVNIRRAFTQLQHQMKANDQLFVLMVGHGTYDGNWSKFNLPGPDLRDIDFGEFLNQLPTKKVILVNTASASGPFIDHLSGEKRVIITATKSGLEYHETSFADFFLEAMTSREADKNKDERISTLEAFQFAKARQDAWYDEQRRLRAEHPTLDDNGDGFGTHDVESGDDGLWASRTFVAPVPPQMKSSVSKLKSGSLSRVDSLRLEKLQLEQNIADLKAQKEQLSGTEYARQLESLLIRLAKTSKELRELDPQKK